MKEVWEGFAFKTDGQFLQREGLETFGKLGPNVSLLPTAESWATTPWGRSRSNYEAVPVRLTAEIMPVEGAAG